MARYRKIEVRMWSDKKFCALSSPNPCGQALWMFLLTGPHTGPIPGLFRASRGQMADELGWDLEGFDEAFREVLSLGMAKADTKAKLIWLPNALKLNKPESPNVVKSWSSEWELLPECDLKDEAKNSIIAQLSEFGESFVNAFIENIGINNNDLNNSGKPSGKPSSKPSGKPCLNQEQQTGAAIENRNSKQEKEKRLAANAACAEPSQASAPPSTTKPQIAIFPSQDDETALAADTEADDLPKRPGKKPSKRSGIDGLGTVEQTPSPTVIELPLNVNGTYHAVTQRDVCEWESLYPAVDVSQQLRNMLGWCLANPEKRKTASGIRRFINSWLAGEQNRGGSGLARASPSGVPVTTRLTKVGEHNALVSKAWMERKQREMKNAK